MLSVSEQCRILMLPRSSYYAKRGQKEDRLQMMEDSEHARQCEIVLGRWTDYPAYGYQKMSRDLLGSGLTWATEHEVRKIYRELGIKGIEPRFITTRPSKGGCRKFPYLLRNRRARYCNEIWATDITYIKLGSRMVYFTAIIDLRSRKILSWRLSETMDAGFCMDALMEAIIRYGVPAIFNTDQGSQYTSGEFTGILESYGIQISMDGIGRCKDNIIVERTWRTLKYEWVFLRDFNSYSQLEESLGEFVEFFNTKRIHQALDYKTPDEVYAEGTFSNIDNGNKVA